MQSIGGIIGHICDLSHKKVTISKNVKNRDFFKISFSNVSYMYIKLCIFDIYKLFICDRKSVSMYTVHRTIVHSIVHSLVANVFRIGGFRLVLGKLFSLFSSLYALLYGSDYKLAFVLLLLESFPLEKLLLLDVGMKSQQFEGKNRKVLFHCRIPLPGQVHTLWLKLNWGVIKCNNLR